MTRIAAGTGVATGTGVAAATGIGARARTGIAAGAAGTDSGSSVTSEAKKSASPKTCWSQGHNPHMRKPDTALSCVELLANSFPNSSAIWKNVIRLPGFDTIQLSAAAL